MSIRLRLTLWYSGILAVTLLLFGLTLYFFLSYSTRADYEANLKTQASEIWSRVDKWLRLSMTGPSLELELDREDFMAKDYYIQLVNFAKGEVKQSSNVIRHRIRIPTDQLEKKTADGAIYETFRTNDIPFLVYEIPVEIQGKIVGVLQVAVSTLSTDEFLTVLRNIMIISFVTILLLSASLGWFMSGKALRPIDDVIDAAQMIEQETDLSRRIEYRGPPDEVGRLTKQINGMLTRIQAMYEELEEAYRNQRRFVSDASHELRTPLTTIRGNVDLLDKLWNTDGDGADSDESISHKQVAQESLKDISDEANRMTRLVNELLSLARADAGFHFEKQPVELMPLVMETVRRVSFLPRGAEVLWEVGDLSPLEGIWMDGNRDYLQQLVFILIDNAFKYTDHGSVTIDAIWERQAGQVGLRIQDTGVGMDKEEVPQIFERFYRADPSRGKTSGSGLGLSIARWIIDEHNGSIEVKTRKGEGSAFTVWLPAYERNAVDV